MIEDIVAAGLRALAEQERIPPAERFDRMVAAGVIDARGRLLHTEGDGHDDIGLGELARELSR